MTAKPFHYNPNTHICSGHCHEKLTWPNIACQLLDYYMRVKDDGVCFPNHIVLWYEYRPACASLCGWLHHWGDEDGTNHRPLVMEVDHWSLGWEGPFGMAERLSTPDEDGWEFFPAK